MASRQRLLLHIPLREDSYQRSDGDSLTNGIRRCDLKSIINNPTVNIYNKQCVVIFGSFSQELVQNANNEINQLNCQRKISNLIQPLKRYLLKDRTIIYFSGVSHFRGKPTFFKDAVNSIGNKLAENDNTAIIATDMSDVLRLQFEWFVDVKYKQQETNGLIALNPLELPTAMLPDLCDVCIVFVENESDCNEMNCFLRRGKLVIPVLLNKMERFAPLNSVVESIEYIFDIERKYLLLNSNNYENVARIVSEMISLEKERSETIASVMRRA